MEINKKDLISLVQQTKIFTSPKIELEQYCTDANSAVDIIYFAGVEFNDIKNRLIFDLGAGTGRLSISCAYLQAKYVLSIDIDFDAIKILKGNVKDLDLEAVILPICADINRFEISAQLFPKELNITTIMNPPFGVQKKTADRFFLQKAFAFSDVVYSIHLANEKVHNFISKFVSSKNWSINYVLPFNLVLERSFPFHTKKTKKVAVNVYRFIKN
ncbi:MAG: DNA methylase [Promethearchaeota archaeon Loki_b31]|nr:MAG: DNA methylase [Candidatus Lokiarchaeota archaeon Loki_b31]